MRTRLPFTTYILMGEEGFRLSAGIAYPVGAAAAAALLCIYLFKGRKKLCPVRRL